MNDLRCAPWNHFVFGGQEVHGWNLYLRSVIHDVYSLHFTQSADDNIWRDLRQRRSQQSDKLFSRELAKQSVA